MLNIFPCRRTIVSEIEDVRSGRWDDKLKAKISGVPLPESIPHVGKSASTSIYPGLHLPKPRRISHEDPADEISSSSLTDSASPQSQHKVRIRAYTVLSCSSVLRYQDLEDASKGKEPISEVLSDTTQKIESPEPHIASPHEVRNSLRRTSPDDSERSRSQVISGPHSRAPSVRTLSPALSQGKVQADDEASAGDAPHHTRRKSYVSCICDRGLNPMLGTPATNFPFARVRVHGRGTDRPTTPTQPDKAVSEWPQSEDQEPSKLDARPLIAPYDNDSHVLTEKLGEGDVVPMLPLYSALTESSPQESGRPLLRKE